MASMFAIIKRVLISSTDVLIFLFNVYVRPILEYGTQLFNSQQKKIANYLERPQKLFTRILYRRQHKFGIIPPYPSRLKLYNIKSLHERRNIIDIETAYDYLHTNLPNDSSLRFTPTYDTRFKKSYSTTEKLTNKYRLRHFSIRTWHLLNNIKNVNISSFTKKKQLKQYLLNTENENYYS